MKASVQAYFIIKRFFRVCPINEAFIIIKAMILMVLFAEKNFSLCFFPEFDLAHLPLIHSLPHSKAWNG